ncbi:MAG: DsbA family protein [Chloroflexi bacterium]|nr:DsbA family protein [Chloroflexota bacterium]
MNRTDYELWIFSEPLCTWCWGVEPVVRKIEGAFEGQLRVRTLLGGLIPDITEMYDEFEAPEQTIASVSKVIFDHWQHATQNHKMPVTTNPLTLFDEENRSSFPVNIAYYAAKLAAPDKANDYLRWLREKVMVYDVKINRRSELLQLAKELNIDLQKFTEAFDDGTALKAFREDLAVGVEEAIQIYPTWIIKSATGKSRVNSFHHYPRLEKAIIDFGAGDLVPKPLIYSEETAMEYFARYLSSAPIEFAVYFDLEQDKAEEILDRMAAEKKILKVEAGNGALYYHPDA